MREILFRGKRVDNNEWVYGFLSKSRGNNHFLSLCIDHEENGVMLSSIVEPETIGQYTGLTDKNGKKIFEGDIVEFGEYRYTVEWKRDRCGFGYEETDDRMLECDGGHCVVVGSIFDNHESLKRGDR